MNKIKNIIEAIRSVSIECDNLINALEQDHDAEDNDWYAELKEYAGIYSVFFELARYIEKLEIRQKEDELKALFNLIEVWLSYNDDYIGESVTVGLLEELISLNSDHHLADESLFKYMGKETRYWASRIKGFWDDSEIISDSRNV